jgi:predicted enzyme related to lactoylglutathione lyase
MADFGHRPEFCGEIASRAINPAWGDKMNPSRLLWLALGLGIFLAPAGLRADPVGRITGVGGIFVRSKDPKALAAWYRDVLGVTLESWGGAKLGSKAPGRPDFVVWSAFPQSTTYMSPSTREFMIDFTVDDLDAILGKLKAKGVPMLKRDSDPTGSFAWILDPDGTKIELWQPKAK